MPLKKEVIDITCNQHCPNKSEQVLKLQLAFARQACFGNGVSWVAGTICIPIHLNVFTLVASIISLLPILTVVLFGLWSLVFGVSTDNGALKHPCVVSKTLRRRPSTKENPSLPVGTR